MNTATENSALVLVNNDIIIQGVFSFCSDPLAFRQVCLAFRDRITDYDSNLWIDSFPLGVCDDEMDGGVVSPAAKYMWKYANVSYLEGWIYEPLYSYLLTNRILETRKEIISESPGACVALASRHNDPKYLSACLRDSYYIVEAQGAWSEVPEDNLIGLLASLIASSLENPKRDPIIILIANMLYCNYDDDDYSDLFQKIEETGVSTDDIMRLYENIVESRLATLMVTDLFVRIIFTKEGLRACILFKKTHTPESLYRVAVPILEKMFKDSCTPAGPKLSLDEAEEAYTFYGDMQGYSYEEECYE